MDIEILKEHILENNFIPTILEELGCHHIRKKDGYFQCANPDGDNVTAVCVYENTNLTTINYTRDISNGKNIHTDLISLVEFYKNETFPYAVKWICDVLDIDYYSNLDEDLPKSLQLTKMLVEMQISDAETDEFMKNLCKDSVKRSREEKLEEIERNERIKKQKEANEGLALNILLKANGNEETMNQACDLIKELGLVEDYR